MSSSYVLPFNDTSSSFTYQPANAWFALPWNASNVGQTGTMHVADDLAAVVTFTFPVPAIAFSYFGFRRSSGGLYELCVDCTTEAPNFVTVDAFNATDDGRNPPVLLYNQTFSTLGTHTITIQNVADSRGSKPGTSQITMDRIELTVLSSPSVITTTFTASITPTTSSTTTSSSTSSTSSPPPVGAIVGGVLGVLALLIGVSIFLYCRRLRRAPEHKVDELRTRIEPLEDPSILEITEIYDAPTILTPPVMSSNLSLRGSEYRLSGAFISSEKEGATLRNMHQVAPSITSIATSTMPPPSQPPSSASAYYPGAGSSITSPTFVPASGLAQRESDGGPLPVRVDGEEANLPPEYGQVFTRQIDNKRK